MRDRALEQRRDDLLRIAETALAERFPGRSRAQQHSGGTTPATVRFRVEEEWFPTAKAAYCWPMGKFIMDRPDILTGEKWRREFVATGRSVNYFAQDPKSLFPRAQHRANDPSMYSRIGDGWFADLNLKNHTKFEVPCRCAAAAGYEHKKDRNWAVGGKEQTPWPF